MNFKIAKIVNAVDYFYKAAGLIQVPEELLSSVEDWAISYACSKVIDDIENIFEENLHKIVKQTQRNKTYKQFAPLLSEKFNYLNHLKIVCRSFVKAKPVQKKSFFFPIKKIPYFKTKGHVLENDFVKFDCQFDWKIPTGSLGAFDFSTGLDELIEKQEGEIAPNNIIHLGKLSIYNCLLVSPVISTIPIEFKEDGEYSRYISLEKDILSLVNQIKETTRHELIHAIQFFISIMVNKYYLKETEIIPNRVKFEGGPGKKLSPVQFDYSKEKFDVFSLYGSEDKEEKKEIAAFLKEEKEFNKKLEELDISKLFHMDFIRLWTNQISLEEFLNSLRGKKVFRKLQVLESNKGKMFPRKFFANLKAENPEKYKAYVKQFMLSSFVTPHPLKEQEFYTRLSDEIHEFNDVKKSMPIQFHQEFARAWLDFKYYSTFRKTILNYVEENKESLTQQQKNLIFSALNNADDRMFFRTLAKEHPDKYEKAAKEFFKNTL